MLQRWIKTVSKLEEKKLRTARGHGHGHGIFLLATFSHVAWWPGHGHGIFILATHPGGVCSESGLWALAKICPNFAIVYQTVTVTLIVTVWL